MKKNTKILSIVILIILIIIGVYAGINYKNESENKEFKEVLKNASNIENVTDQHYMDLYSGTSISIDEYIKFTKSDIENNSKQSDMLKEFKEKTSNQTQKDYLEIEIRRLQKEKLFHERALDTGNQYKRYLNGEITSNKYIEVTNMNNKECDKLQEDVGIIKDEAITFIDNHHDLKEILKEINVDEDFYSNELGGTSGNGRVYFTK